MSSKSFSISINKKIPSFKKIIKVDSDKSISIRSLLIGAISNNVSYIKNILESEDVKSTIACLKKLGVKISKKKGIYFVNGKGLGSLFAKKNTTLNFGNSGTLARLMIGILSSIPNIELNLDGEECSLSPIDYVGENTYTISEVNNALSTAKNYLAVKGGSEGIIQFSWDVSQNSNSKAFVARRG